MNEPIHPIGRLRPPRATSPTFDRLDVENFISARTHDRGVFAFGVSMYDGTLLVGFSGSNEMLGLLFAWRY